MSQPIPLAVLTGDLIGSTRMVPTRLEQAFTTLTSAAARIDGWQAYPTHFSRYRGDGWQIALLRPQLALRAALFLRASLRAAGRDLSTRIAIAAGTGRPPQSPDLNTATGAVFVASGRALDAMEPQAQLTFAAGGALGAAVRLADALSRSWTVAQARAIAPMLGPEPPTHFAVAESLSITRQAVEQALAAASYSALSEALALIEADHAS